MAALLSMGKSGIRSKIKAPQPERFYLNYRPNQQGLKTKTYASVQAYKIGFKIACIAAICV
jgi:hypothetical protein